LFFVRMPARRSTSFFGHQLKALVLLVACMLVVGCATTQPSAYEKAAALPTPNTLFPNSRWAIVLLDEHGQVAGTIVVKLSDAPVKTCDSGEYRRAEVLADHRVDGGIPLYNPAYEVTGAALRIQLATGLCDGGYAIIGGVTESGFEGVHMPEVIIVPKSEQRAERRAFGVSIPE
jgi:hypothetical protein